MAKKVGRNESCPCGSGKKYKKCCLSAHESQGTVSGRGKFRFEPGSYGSPESCVPSIACLKQVENSRWEYHFVLVRPDEPLDDPDRACSIATADLNAAASRKANAGTDEDVALVLRDRGYVAVDDFGVVEHDSSVAAWMGSDGLHVMAPGGPPSSDFLARATKTYQEKIRKSPLWATMVDEFGREEAEQLLAQMRVRAPEGQHS